MKSTNIFDLDQLGFRVPRGVHFWMTEAANALGVSLGEWLRATFWLVPDERGTPRLVVRQPSPEHIGVVGANGRFAGTLAQIMAGVVAIDGPEDEARGPGAARVQPIVVDHTDLERAADGSLTGRLSPTRRIRQPGRKRTVKVERARKALADLTAGGGHGHG